MDRAGVGRDERDGDIMKSLRAILRANKIARDSGPPVKLISGGTVSSRNVMRRSSLRPIRQLSRPKYCVVRDFHVRSLKDMKEVLEAARTFSEKRRWIESV